MSTSSLNGIDKSVDYRDNFKVGKMFEELVSDTLMEFKTRLELILNNTVVLSEFLKTSTPNSFESFRMTVQHLSSAFSDLDINLESLTSFNNKKSMLKSNPDGLLKIQELKDALAEQKKINFELNEKRNEMNETMDKLVETVKKKEAIEVELREKLADIEEAHNYLLQSLKYTQKSLEYKKHDIYKLENINSALKKMLENDEETAGPEAQQTAVKNSVGSSSSVQIQAKETSVLANVAPEAETVNLAREQKKALDTPSKVLNRCRIFQLAIKQLPQYDQNKHSALDKSFSNILDSNLPQKVSTNPFDDNYFEASSSTSKHAALSSKPENVPIDGYTGESFEELSEATLGMPKKNRVLKFKSKF